MQSCFCPRLVPSRVRDAPAEGRVPLKGLGIPLQGLGVIPLKGLGVIPLQGVGGGAIESVGYTLY